MQYLRLAAAAIELNISESTFRWLRFRSKDRVNSKGQVIPGNGFDKAFLKLQGSLYLDVPYFKEIWLEQNGRTDLPPLDPSADAKPALSAHPATGGKFCPECGTRLNSSNTPKEQ